MVSAPQGLPAQTVMGPLASAPQGPNSSDRGDEPSDNVARTPAFPTTQQVPASAVVPLAVGAPPLPTHMGRYDLMRPKSAATPARWRVASSAHSSPSSSVGSLPVLPTNLAQLRAQSSAPSPSQPSEGTLSKASAGKVQKLQGSQQFRAQLMDALPKATVAERLAAAKRKVEESVGGAARGETVDFNSPAGQTHLSGRPSWARALPDHPPSEGTPSQVEREVTPRHKSPRVDMPNAGPATALVPSSPAGSVPVRIDIGPAPIEDVQQAARTAASSTKTLEASSECPRSQVQASSESPGSQVQKKQLEQQLREQQLEIEALLSPSA